jgi:hypothetical protein
MAGIYGINSVALPYPEFGAGGYGRLFFAFLGRGYCNTFLIFVYQ